MKCNVLYITLLTVIATNVTAMDSSIEKKDDKKKREFGVQRPEGWFKKVASKIWYGNNTTKALAAYLDQDTIAQEDRQIAINATGWGVDEQLEELVNNRESNPSTTETLLETQKKDMQSFQPLYDMAQGVEKHKLQLSEDKYKAMYQAAQQGQKNEVEYLAQALFNGLDRYASLQALMNKINELKLKKDLNHRNESTTSESLLRLVHQRVEEKEAQAKKMKQKESEKTESENSSEEKNTTPTPKKNQRVARNKAKKHNKK